MLRETRGGGTETPTVAQCPVLPTFVGRDACDDRAVAPSALLVDDTPDYLALLTRVLEGMGIEVVATAPDAASAIRAAGSTKPDIALVDVGLPDRDGVDLAYELADLPWRPRVVLMSTDKDAVSGVEARPGRDALAFIPKDDLADGRLSRLLSSE
jgi:CheY-like chemotaxis protein